MSKPITGFELLEKEVEQAEEFKEKHRCSSKNKKRDVTGANRIFSYTFTLTGIGVGVTVSCSCGKEKNVTDYDSW